MGSKNKRKDVPEAVTDTRKDTYDWIQCLISALIICVLLFVFVTVSYTHLTLPTN